MELAKWFWWLGSADRDEWYGRGEEYEAGGERKIGVGLGVGRRSAGGTEPGRSY
jgi:hypothetical protein